VVLTAAKAYMSVKESAYVEEEVKDVMVRTTEFFHVPQMAVANS
jgi:hypothetical protein